MRISVYYRLILNVHCLASVLEGIETFLIIALGWTYASDHVSIGVATQTILQNTSQLAIPVCDKL